MYIYKTIFVNGLQVLGNKCPYYANLCNFLIYCTIYNNDSVIFK